jgi:hypothetical protein
VDNKAQQQLLRIISRNTRAVKKAITSGRLPKEDGVSSMLSKADKATDKNVSNMWRWAARDLNNL